MYLMRVFISSVRTGLEEERKALPGIIRAVGHTPVRFEDFSAQNDPSREACLQGVSESDIYLLVLGPKYGHRFADTGKSPTHEEWTAATAAGKMRVVYRKKGVQFESEQQQLSRQISDYTMGVFHDSFRDTAELLTKVAAKLRELDVASSDLNFELLESIPSFEWCGDAEGRRAQGTSGSLLEIHAIPLGTSPYPSRIIIKLTDSLVDRIRASGFLDSGLALEIAANEGGATVIAPSSRPRSWDDARPGEVVGLRVAKTGQVSVWATLPADSMGSILDPNKLPEQIAGMLRLVGALNLIEAERIAIGVGVDPTNMLTVDGFDEHRGRNRAVGVSLSNEPLRVNPDESVSVTALNAGATEVANHLARALIGKFKAHH